MIPDIPGFIERRYNTQQFSTEKWIINSYTVIPLSLPILITTKTVHKLTPIQDSEPKWFWMSIACYTTNHLSQRCLFPDLGGFQEQTGFGPVLQVSVLEIRGVFKDSLFPISWLNILSSRSEKQCLKFSAFLSFPRAGGSTLNIFAHRHLKNWANSSSVGSQLEVKCKGQ